MRTACKVCVSKVWHDTDLLSFAQRPTENVALICDSSLTSLGPCPLATTSHSAETERQYWVDGQHNMTLNHLQHWFTDSHTSEIKKCLWYTQGKCATKHRTLESSISEGAPDPGTRANGELQKVRMLYIVGFVMELNKVPFLFTLYMLPCPGTGGWPTLLGCK